MTDHRIRLTDDDIVLIVASLQARRASSGETRQHEIDRLVTRLCHGRPGNPKLIFDAESQEHATTS